MWKFTKFSMKCKNFINNRKSLKVGLDILYLILSKRLLTTLLIISFICYMMCVACAYCSVLLCMFKTSVDPKREVCKDVRTVPLYFYTKNIADVNIHITRIRNLSTFIVLKRFVWQCWKSLQVKIKLNTPLVETTKSQVVK